MALPGGDDRGDEPGGAAPGVPPEILRLRPWTDRILVSGLAILPEPIAAAPPVSSVIPS